MPTVFWILIGVIMLAACSGIGKKAAARKGPYRIDRPHVIEPDDCECSVCRRRFRKKQTVCPYCGARFAGQVTDEGEFTEEEDELEDWDEEDGP